MIWNFGRENLLIDVLLFATRHALQRGIFFHVLKKDDGTQYDHPTAS